ncbi:MAG: chemotaxis protein CheX [Planctomycetota bacterium]|jgi:CheY-specific phosphatase CheX|nr:chemotaxis protein CheX [Planctomycetota bacterium]
MRLLQMDERLVGVLIKATRDGLAMGGMKPIPMGASRRFVCSRDVTAIIGCVGASSGSVFINCSKECATFMASKMLGEERKSLDNAVLDGICEIANIIAGQTKALLSTTEFKFERISTPAVVVGSNYLVSHYKGATTVSLDFEMEGVPASVTEDMTFTVAMFLVKI